MEKLPAGQWLEQALKTHGDSLLRLCFLYLHDRHLAEDALQETFLRAFRSYSSFRGDSCEKTWLTRIAINVCKSSLRWERPLPLSDAPEGSYESQFRDDTVLQAVCSLPPKLREVVLLYYYQELSTPEIATLLHLPRNVITSRLSRGRAQLKTQLKGWFLMNSLKQNLDNALDSLELTPAMEAEILMNASAPARKTRRRSRAVIAALLVVCLLSITAISAAMGSGWQIRKEGKELVATPDQPTHAQLSKKAMKLIEKCIETKERRMGYDDVEQFADAFGYKLLKIDPLQLEPFDDVQKNVRVNVGGLHAESAQITARYHGRMFGESGKQTAHVSIHTCLDMDVDPHDITHTFAFESEDGDESVGQHPVFSTYYLTSLGATAEIMSWPEDVFMGIEAFFIHKNVTYHVSIHVPTNVLSTHESMLADCHAILDMMHE